MPCAWWPVSRETQKTRLALRNGFREDMIEAILAAQRPIMEKWPRPISSSGTKDRRTCSASKSKDSTNIFFMTEELDNKPLPSGEDPQAAPPSPFPHRKGFLRNIRLPLRRKTQGIRPALRQSRPGRRKPPLPFRNRLTSMNCGNAP